MSATASHLMTENSEHRKQHRKRILMAARIVAKDGQTFLNCTIVDLSVSGARLRLPSSRSLSNDFHLIDVGARMAHDAQLVWRKGDYAGVRFTANYALDNSLPDKLGHLRKHWLERATG